MLTPQFVLVTRLSGMEGSFLWRSQRHLHGESPTLELRTSWRQWNGRITLVASVCTDFTVQKKVTNYRYAILGTCRKFTQVHANLAFDAVLGVRVIMHFLVDSYERIRCDVTT